MISHVYIRDFAIIESIDIDIKKGLNIITGETGSGKSIIIEAISMALGGRADKSMVRHGAGKAVIQLVIDESEIPESACTGIEILSREISKEGKSLCRIDGELVTLAELKKATTQICDIHGQYDHQRLLDPVNHIEIIDAYGTDKIAGTKERVREAWDVYAGIKRRLDSVLSSEMQSKRELDFLRYEVSEIDAARPRPGEYEELKSELKIMQNSERIHEALASAYGKLAGEGVDSDSISDVLATVEHALRAISELSGEYGAMKETVSELSLRTSELAREIRDKLDALDFSGQVINDTIERIDVLDRLMSKYGNTIDDVISHRDKAAERLENIDDLDNLKASLSEEIAVAAKVLESESIVLSKLRANAAKELEAGVTAQLRELNFNDAVFLVNFGGEAVDPSDYGPNGIDRLDFFLSANKGQPPLPVAKVASGGEISRIMLAMKSVIGDFDSIPTMIFDEIDTGISGVTASIVGEKLKRMAGGRQILCITHLPQIAAFADDHFIIEKRSDDENTYTTVSELPYNGRVEEVARLIGGRGVTKTTLASAKELIDSSCG